MVSGIQHILNYDAVRTTPQFCALCCLVVYCFALSPTSGKTCPCTRYTPRLYIKHPVVVHAANNNMLKHAPATTSRRPPATYANTPPAHATPAHSSPAPHLASRLPLATVSGSAFRNSAPPSSSGIALARAVRAYIFGTSYARFVLQQLLSLIRARYVPLHTRQPRLRRCTVSGVDVRHRRLVRLQLRRVLISVKLPYGRAVVRKPPKCNHAYVDALFRVLTSATDVWYASSFAAYLSGSNSHTGER